VNPLATFVAQCRRVLLTGISGSNVLALLNFNFANIPTSKGKSNAPGAFLCKNALPDWGKVIFVVGVRVLGEIPMAQSAQLLKVIHYKPVMILRKKWQKGVNVNA
jgi:hypothetical protein